MPVIGAKKTQRIIVAETQTAAALGSGMLEVYSTPAMIALMENTAQTLAAEGLEAGQTTVGTALNIRHVSASPVGSNITCEAVLTGADRRRLTFDVRAWDDAGLIGEGTHERFIVDADRFMEKTLAKLNGRERRPEA